MLTISLPLHFALILELSAVLIVSEMGTVFSSSERCGVRESVVPELTLMRFTRFEEEVGIELANRAIDSEKSLLGSHSDSRARFAFPLNICFIRVSSFVLRSSFFFCRQVLTS